MYRNTQWIFSFIINKIKFLILFFISLYFEFYCIFFLSSLGYKIHWNMHYKGDHFSGVKLEKLWKTVVNMSSTWVRDGGPRWTQVWASGVLGEHGHLGSCSSARPSKVASEKMLGQVHLFYSFILKSTIFLLRGVS